MSGLQKIIKYLAIAFAIFLTFSIISGIMYGISFIGDILDGDKDSITEELKDLEINDNTLLLDIHVSSSSIILKSGDFFKAETNNKYINSKQDKNKLYIQEKKHNWFHNDKSELIVYIPNDFVFDGVSIETGAGKVDIEQLSTKQLYLVLGAGKVDINNLNVSESTKIDGGAGEININAISMNNLDLDMGVGKLSLTSKLTGKNKIDSGIGGVNLSLIGIIEDYEISLDKGIGEAKINGKTMKDDTNYGTGNNKLDIDGGIGSINIEIKEDVDVR